MGSALIMFTVPEEVLGQPRFRSARSRGYRGSSHPRGTNKTREVRAAPMRKIRDVLVGTTFGGRCDTVFDQNMRFIADPFDIEVVNTDQDDPVDFAEILRATWHLPPRPFGKVGTRWGPNGASYIQLAMFDEQNGYIVGTAYQARMYDLHTKAGPDGEMDIDLDDDQGLGKHAAFLWDKNDRVFWFQRDRNAITHRQFMDYLRDKSNRSIHCNPRLGREPAKRAKKLKRIKSVSLTLQDNSDARTRLPDAPHISQIWRWRQEFGGVRIEVTITPARGEYLGEDSKLLVDEAVKMFEDQAPELKSAKIVGSDVDYQTDESDKLVDLLHDRYLFSADVSDDRFRKPGPLMNLMTSVWRKNRSRVE